MKDGMQAESIAVLGNNVALPMGLTVDEIVIEAGETRAKFKPFSIELDQPGQIKARISAASIAAFLNKEAPGGLKDFAVTIADGFLTAEATARIIVELRVAAVCRLRIAERTQLWVDLESVSVKAPMAHSMVEQQLAKVNPLVDLKELASNLTLDAVTAEAGFVTVTGTGKWP